MNELTTRVLGVLEIACVLGLSYIALKADRDRQKAEIKLACVEMDNIAKNVKIRLLEKKLEILQDSKES